MPIVPAFFYFAFPHTIENYFDPGKGSIILQAVIGVAVGGLFTITLFWNRVKAHFKGLLSGGEKDNRDQG